jgi:1,4-alpha-glucan branching enzyme
VSRVAAGAGAGPVPGELAIVLHSHMPYVEGYGTWPSGEEWLWEAVATSYLPLLEVLDPAGPVTLSVTPVLADQLAAPGVAQRMTTFLGKVRSSTHAHDIAEAENPAVAAELERSAEDYAQAVARLAALGPGGLVEALAPHAAWTSSATHAVLPLLATDAGVRLQLETGISAHRAHFAGVRPWRGGMWLPECAYAPWLDRLLAEAGVRMCCVDLTDVLGRGAPQQLRPMATREGPVLAPIDRELLDALWSAGGYPGGEAYRNYHGLTFNHHRAWANDGQVYDRARGAAQARADAADFVARARQRLRDGGLAVCALDTELLGHWWFEGPVWLAAVLEEAERTGLRITHLDDALERHGPVEADTLPDLGITTWGTPRDLSTWSGPNVAEIAFAARRAELDVLAAGRPDAAAVRELLALQSSDWAFLASGPLAASYGRERAALHRAGVERALGGISSAPPRNLAVHALPAPLLAP